MKFVQDFQKFVMRGNVLDLAIGFTVGAAFSTIVKSLVDDVIMPPIGLLMGQVDFTDLYFTIKQGSEELAANATLEQAKAAGAVTINYGIFINNVIALLIVAAAMFAIIRFVNSLDERLERQFAGKKAPGEPADKKCPHCLSTIPYRATRCGHCTSQLDAVAEG